MKSFLRRRWFLLCLAAVLVLGMSLHQSLIGLASLAWLRYTVVAGVLFVMALPLEASAMRRTLARPGAPLLASAINLGVLPLVGWAVMAQLDGTLLSRDMAYGILVAVTTPCTLASASVWTRRAGGNDAVSIMVTVITNLLCFVVTPMWLVTMTGKLPHITPQSMITRLGLIVVLPMVAAQLIRLRKPWAAAATRHKTGLGVVAQFGILTMVLIGAIRTGERLWAEGAGDRPLPLELTVVLVVVVAIHLSMLYAGWMLARGAGMSREDAIAVGISGSQKTLMVGLQVSIELQVSILPMISYHVGQLLLDTVVADRWAGQRQNRGQAAG